MRCFHTFLTVFCFHLTVSSAAYCSGSPDEGQRTNEFDISASNIQFVRSVSNAQLFTAGPDNARFPVVHLYGNAYEVGLAQGQLLSHEIRQFVDLTWAYLIAMTVEGDMFSCFLRQFLSCCCSLSFKSFS